MRIRLPVCEPGRETLRHRRTARPHPWSVRERQRHPHELRPPAAVGPDSQEDHHVPQLEDRSEEHTSELQSRGHLVCRLLLEKKKNTYSTNTPTDSTRTSDIT